jgi:L-threonylcarbamoyladenylate synthase
VKARSLEPAAKTRKVSHAKLDFRFQGHGSRKYSGPRGPLAAGAAWQGTSADPNGDNERVKTLRLSIDPGRLKSPEALQALDRAAFLLRGGGLVALPTETVYGLGANALDPAAVARIFAAKERPAWDPVIVHIASLAMLQRLVTEVSEPAGLLMKAFWPGPLTLLLPRSTEVPDAVTAGRPLVGVRMPSHPVALALIRRAGVPVAAPSANLFGHVSPTTAAHVLDDLDGRIDAVLDAGPALHGVESTVLDVSQSPMRIYRPGAITADQINDQISALADPVAVFREDAEPDSAPAQGLPAPGVGLRHYSPRARLVLVEAPLAELALRLDETAQKENGARLGVMLPAEIGAPEGIPPARVFPWGRWSAPEEMAERLYAGLRALDAQGCDVILCPLPPAEGVGAALRDRLRKGARTRD